MHYTVSALAPSEQAIFTMKQGLLALGARLETIIIRPGRPGHSLPEIAVITADHELAEAYREALQCAGGTMLTSTEESSVHDAIT